MYKCHFFQQAADVLSVPEKVKYLNAGRYAEKFNFIFGDQDAYLFIPGAEAEIGKGGDAIRGY